MDTRISPVHVRDADFEACADGSLLVRNPEPLGSCPKRMTERLEQIHTANTSLRVLRAACEVLRERSKNITIVESDDPVAVFRDACSEFRRPGVLLLT